MTAPFMVTIMPGIYCQEEVTYGIFSKVSYVCMIHAQIPNILLENILYSRCVECYSIFRETLSCIGIYNGIWELMSKPLGFRVNTKISLELCPKMQVVVSNRMMFVIVDTLLLSFIAMMTYLTQNVIFVWPVRDSFGF